MPVTPILDDGRVFYVTDRGGFKVDLSYGHQRAGLVCSGGVCRWQPEYTGGILRLSYNF